jgi:mannosyltransferase OCH1-like enzyme
MLQFITKKEQIKQKQEKYEKIKAVLQNRPYTYLKPYYNPIIPLKVYMTWHTKDLPVKMQENVNKLKEINPRFEVIIFDDNDCYNFIKTNFDESVLNAFTNLVPGAYKADLWRLCVLYINGGYYLDIKMNCINGFKLIELSEKEHLVSDIPPYHIYNAIMICKQGNPFLLKCIEEIVNNVKTGFYGRSPLDPTGPGLIGNVALKYGFNNYLSNVTDMKLSKYGNFIVYKGIAVIQGYGEYLAERIQFKKTDYYTDIWYRKQIYK